MAKTLQKKIKFSKGQVSPELIERTDLDFYDSSAQKMQNVISTVYGGVKSRYGTRFLDFITDVDEREPDSITSDIFNDTTHFTDLTPVESNVISTNKLLAQFDYGTNEAGVCKIEIKNIYIVPQIIEHKTSGTHTDTYEGGKYSIELVGAGGAGSVVSNFSEYTMVHKGGSGAYVFGKKQITAGSNDAIVGAGGVYPGINGGAGGDGGDTSFANEIAGGGKGGVSGGYSNPGHNGDGGTATTTLSFKNGRSDGASVYGGYGVGNSNKNGGDGYFRAVLDTSYKLVIYGSTDGVDWDEVATRSIGTVAYDVVVSMGYLYRYVKIEIAGNIDSRSKIAFSYIRNNKSILDASNMKIRMEKFVYNNEEKYLLVFTDEFVQIYKDDVLVQMVTATGLDEDYLKDMSVAYKDDTIIITHPDMPPKQLQRQASNNWVWSDFFSVIKNIPYYAFGGETTTHKTTKITPSALEGTVKITAASSTFDADYVGQIIDGNGGRVRVTEYVSGTVVNGVTIIPFYTTDGITSWDYITGYKPVWGYENPLDPTSTNHGYPSTCLFAQQRLWFGGSKELPSRIWASRLDDYNNFKNSGNYDNDSIDVTMLTNNKILNLVEQRGIHIFTSGDEWTIQEGTYTPDKITIIKNTNNGSLGIKPTILSGAICFVEKNGKSLLSYIYNYEQSSFMTENISLFSNLIHDPIALDTEVNSSKDKSDFIYLVLDDGTMLTGCMLLDQRITSISEYKTDGHIVDVCCLGDETYIIVNRQNIMSLEKISKDLTDYTIERYIDSYEQDGLYNYNECFVYVYSDNTVYGKFYCTGNSIVLDTVPNEMCKIGLAYDYYLESNPIAINGKTTSIKKRIAKATLTCKDTKELEFNGQKKKSKDDIFDFYSCTKYGNDVRFKVQGEFYPVEILSIMLNINYEG